MFLIYLFLLFVLFNEYFIVNLKTRGNLFTIFKLNVINEVFKNDDMNCLIDRIEPTEK